jgi:hypothetical protein
VTPSEAVDWIVTKSVPVTVGLEPIVMWNVSVVPTGIAELTGTEKVVEEERDGIPVNRPPEITCISDDESKENELGKIT